MSGVTQRSYSKSKVVGRSMDTAKIWANFNGGVFAERDSFGVSSFTDNGTGDYTVTFNKAMPNSDYAAVVTGVANGGPGGAFLGGVSNNTAYVRIKACYPTDFVTSVSPHNVEYVTVAVFGD